jgi:hypothetical protein
MDFPGRQRQAERAVEQGFCLDLGEPQLPARISASFPAARSRASGSSGSWRAATTTLSPGGRCSVSNPTPSSTRGLVTR